MTRPILHPLMGFVFASFAVSGVTALAAETTPPTSSAGAPKPAAVPPTSAPAAKPVTTPGGTSAVVMDLSSIESVIGRSVKSSAGEDMGRIVDLLVTNAGQVRAAVIDFGGILGVGSRKVAVDWKALDFGELAKGGDIRLALTRNQVRVSPEYKPNDPVVILEATKPEEKPEAAKAPVVAPVTAKPEPATQAAPEKSTPAPQVSAPQDSPTTK